MEYSRNTTEEQNPFSYKNFLNRYGTNRDGLPAVPLQGSSVMQHQQQQLRSQMPIPNQRGTNSRVVHPVRLPQEFSRRPSQTNGSNGKQAHEVHDIFADSGDEGRDDEFPLSYHHTEWLASNAVGVPDKGDDIWLHAGPSFGNGLSQPSHIASTTTGVAPYLEMGNSPSHVDNQRRGSGETRDRAHSNVRIPEGSNGSGNIPSDDFTSRAGSGRLDDRMYITKLRKDVAYYKQKLEETENYAEQTSIELQRCQQELDSLHAQEREETAAMEKVIQHVEANLQSTTRRAMESEAALAGLMEENRALKEHIAELTAENDTLRAKASNDVRRLPAFDKAQNLAKFLQTATQSANLMLRYF